MKEKNNENTNNNSKKKLQSNKGNNECTKINERSYRVFERTPLAFINTNASIVRSNERKTICKRTINEHEC